MKKILVTATAMLLFFACTKHKYEFDPVNDTPTSCDLSQVKYGADISPIIIANCSYTGCHDDNPGYGVNYSFTDYDGIKEAAGSIHDRINRPTGDPLHMPQGFSLDSCSLYKLNVWIANGAPNN